MSLPFIDVVVPTFNRAAMLERAIDSLLAQDYPPEQYRIMIVDDGSTDETWALLQKASAVQDRLRALRIEHRGAYAARNAGWQAGVGEIVAFTDDDCIADPRWLTAIARGFAERPDALGLQGKTVTVREDVTPLTHQIVVRRTDTCYQTCNMAYRRTALSIVGGFDDVSHSGDSQLGAAVLALGPVLFRSDMVIVHPPRPRTFLNRQTWRPHIDGLRRLYSRQPDFFRRYWGRNFPVAVALRWGVGSTAKQVFLNLPWMLWHPSVYLKFVVALLRERAALLAMLPGFWREHRRRIGNKDATSHARPLRLLGVSVHPLTWRDLKAIVVRSVEEKNGWIIAHHNLHSVYFYHHDAEVRSFYARAEWVHIDGMSLVFLGKLLGLPVSRRHRLTHIDWIRPLLSEASRRQWRIFYLGSRPTVAQRAAEVLGREFPGLRLETAHGFFDANTDGAENRAVLDAIGRFRPQLLLVGMGVPRQERWILENREWLCADAIIHTGAMMDYLAGAAAVAPRWMGRLGLEWLFRLASDPARLWKRYLVEPWFVARVFAAERFGRRPRAPGEATP